MDDDALFVQDGETFLPTDSAGNPWGELTGGGPVAGLLARALERAAGDPDLFTARLTVDLMRPVPRVPLTISTRPLRTGKRVKVWEAVLSTGDHVVTRAVGQLVARTNVDGPEAGPVPQFAGPDDVADGRLIPPELELREGVHDIVQARWVDDQVSGPTSRVWLRMPLPLLAGESISPLAHVAVLVDCISAASPLGEIFGPWINTDITLYLHRELEGEWLGLEIERDLQPTGIGVVRSRLHDRRGPIGTAGEAVVVSQFG
nr:thioesterase family protein [Saccharopolyspora sp. HNM0983]